MVNFKSIAITAATFVASGLAIPFTERAVAGTPVKDTYIITLKSGSYSIGEHVHWVNSVHKRSVNKRGLSGVSRTFANIDGFRAYTGEFDEATIEEIKQNLDVLFVEQDRVVVIDPNETTIQVLDDSTQTSAPWGLAALSSSQPGSDTYTYDSRAGEGTFAYVIDTGIRTTHEDFGGRAEFGYTAFSGDTEDTHGHGTHVAGTIVGTKYGVAKKATAIGVKVFGSSGQTTNAAVIGGYDWAVQDIIEKNRTGKAVINMSLGGPFVAALNQAVEDASSSGVISVVAAGNSAANSDSASPASAPSAITVGAVDSTWTIWRASNWGPSLDLFAPGDGVLSADWQSDTASSLKSGTSMAAPHVAGLVLYAQSVNGISGVEAVTSHILGNALPDVVEGNIRSSVNLFSNLG